MKKYLAIYIYYIFYLYINVIIYGGEIGLIGFANLLFLNTSEISSSSSGQFNFQYIIGFYFLFNIFIYILLSNLNESVSFLNMVVYRREKEKTILNILKNNIKKVLLLLFNFSIILFSSYLIFANKSIFIFNVSDFSTIFIYLLRYFTILLFFATIHYYYSLIGKFSKVNFMLLFIYLILILADIIFGVHLVTFSANLMSEIIYLLMFISIFIFSYLAMLNNFKRKGDIL
jgi:hypothetical protein